MSENDLTVVEALQQQKSTPGRKKIYKEVSDEHKGKVLAADMERKVSALRESIRHDRVEWANLEDVQRRSLEYLENCRDAQAIPTVSGLAVFALGTSRQALNEYMRKNPKTATTQFLQQMKDIFADTLETAALNRNIDTVMAIFVMKNDHDRADRLQIEPMPPADPLGSEIDQKVLEERIMNSVVIDDED